MINIGTRTVIIGAEGQKARFLPRGGIMAGWQVTEYGRERQE